MLLHLHDDMIIDHRAAGEAHFVVEDVHGGGAGAHRSDRAGPHA
jgi:hypothetical protein